MFSTIYHHYRESVCEQGIVCEWLTDVLVSDEVWEKRQMSVFSCIVWKGASLVIRCGQISSCSLTVITPLKDSLLFFFLNKSVLIRTDLSLLLDLFPCPPLAHLYFPVRWSLECWAAHAAWCTDPKQKQCHSAFEEMSFRCPQTT